jgi:hypothetical protein
MKTRQLTYLAFALLLGATRSVAGDQTATVKDTFKTVQYGSPTSEKVQTASIGTKISDGEYLKTGVLARAELLLPTESVTRLGANTIFNYSVASNTVDLQAGTILFCKPKDAKQLNIKTAAVTAGIVGTTGFTQIKTTPHTNQKTYVFGLIEGHSTVHVDGQDFSIKAGEILEYTPGSKPVISPFDVPRMVKTSLFFTEFKGPLPNQKYIDAEIAQYLDDQSRGFIQPVNGNQNNTNYAGIPTMPTTALDSAGNANGGKTPPPPPPPDNR